MSNEFAIERNRTGRHVASGNGNPDTQRVLDSEGFSSLSAAERQALTKALEANGNDFGFATELKRLLNDPDFRALEPDERTEMTRQIALNPRADTIRRMRSLADDPAFRELPRDRSVREIQDAVDARPPEVGQLLEEANIQPPPRSRPDFVVALANLGLEVGEAAGAAHGLEAVVGAGAAFFTEVIAGGFVVPALTAYEMGSGIAHANDDGLEWGRRFAHGEGFAAGMARRIVGLSGEAPIPEGIADNPEAVDAYRRGLAQAERNWARLDPGERAALSASPHKGDVIRDIFQHVRERTMYGR